MDDIPVIVNNPDIWSFKNFLVDSYPGRPLRELSFLFDYSLFGLDPWGYHFQNIIWHALNCWMVYLLALRLKLSTTVAWFSSLLFLVHPIQVEVVANSSHRKDSLALAFLLMALLSYMKIFEQKTPLRRLLWFCCACVLWITAYYAKGNTLVFPLLVMSYEYAMVPEDRRVIVRWKKMFPVLCMVSVSGLIGWLCYISTSPTFNIAIMQAFVKTENLTSFSFSAYILMILKSCAFLASKLILPLNLSMEYIYAVPNSLLDPWVLSALILILATGVIAYRWDKKSPELFFLLLFGVILWFPTANVIWYLSYFAADRYMYAPSAGLCVLAVLASEQALRGLRRYFILGWFFILSVCTILTWKQISVWHNEMSLYSQMLKVSPRSLEAMIGLSSAFYSVKNFDKAALYAQQAMDRDSSDERPLINMGSILDEQGKTNQAIELFKSALKIRPNNFNTYVNLGVAYERVNDLLAAEMALNTALSINSNHVPAWYNLGVVRYKKNDKLGARLAFNEVVRRNPSHQDALANLSVICREIGDEACYNDAVRRIDSFESSEAAGLR